MHAIDHFNRHLLTVDNFHIMGEAGIFAPDARVELIEGDIIDMAPIGSGHAGLIAYLIQKITQQLGQQVIVNAQNPIVLSNNSEPQPDLLILKPRDDFYRHSHPVPADVYFIVEVADTTLKYDREIKVPLYAKYDVPEVWLVNIEKGQLEIYRKPDAENQTYLDVQQISRGNASQPSLNLIVDVEEMLGKG